MKNWKMPAVILALLILAMTLRWHTEKTTLPGDTRPNPLANSNPYYFGPKEIIATTMTKVVEDRWNGSVWAEEATATWHTRNLISAPWIELADSYSLTVVSYSLAGLDSAWLLFALLKKRNDGKGSLSI